MLKIVLNKELLRQKYIEEEKPIYIIAKELGVSNGVVRKNLKDYKIQVRNGKSKEYINKCVLENLYFVKMLSYREISKILNVDVNLVRASVSFHHIVPRTRFESIRLLKSGKEMPCEECGTKTYFKKSKIEKQGTFFCSHSCQVKYYGKQRRTPGFKTLEGWRRSGEGRKFRNAVLKRDNNKCMLCGKHHNLEVHHILEISKYPDFRNDIYNGITLCQSCHILLHKNDFTSIESLWKVISIENPNIGETPEMDNPEASIREYLFSLTRSNDYQGNPNL